MTRLAMLGLALMLCGPAARAQVAGGTRDTWRAAALDSVLEAAGAPSATTDSSTAALGSADSAYRSRPDGGGVIGARIDRLHGAPFLVRTPATPVAEPSGVLVDAFGRVWMSDAALHKVMRFEPDGRPLDETGALGSEPGQFRRPGALARVGALGVAVLDIENRRITVYDHHLRLLSGVIDLAAPALEDRIGRVTPVGLTADRGGALYVADAERDRILVFDYSGEFQRELGGFGARAGGFSGLLAVAAGAHGTLVTVERPRGRARRAAAADSVTGRSRVQWLDAGGRVLASTWTPAWRAGAAETGLSLAVDDAGHVAIAGERSGELVVLSSDGTLLARATGIVGPRALAFGAAGELFVAASGEARLLRLVLTPPAAE